MVDELYRFVQLRGVVPAAAGTDLLIRAWSTPPSDLEDQLAAAAESGEEPTSVARQWLEELGQTGPLVVLRRLDSALVGPVETMTVNRLRNLVRRYLDTDEVLDRARAMAQDALLATVLVPEVTAQVRDAAHRLVVLAAAAQRVLRWAARDSDDGRENGKREDGEPAGAGQEARDEALRDMLGRAAAVLSPRMSELLPPGPARQEERPARLQAWRPLDRAGVVAEEDRRRQRDTALSELVGVAVDPQVAPEMAPALREGLPDEVAPRLRPIGETTLRSARLLLRGAVRDRLSESTQALLDEVAPGETDLLSALDAVERATLLARPRQAARAGANDPTGGFPPGYGALRPPVLGLVRPPGVGELLSVRREHDRYLLGPITYIENVLAGESRERRHRRLDRTEETTFTETERTVVDERELQTTERFDLVDETSNEISAQTQLQLGAQVSGSYGTVQASASFGFTSSSASKEATRTATSNSRETVDRALKRISERTLERRQRITIREVEEHNRHELENDSDVNRAGIYRFVDDRQNVGVYSYGLRLMIEAHVPEPGAHLRWAAAASNDGTADPEPPRPALGGVPITSPSQLDPSNYIALAGAYGAVVEPPPQLLETVATSGRQEFSENTPNPATAAFLFYRSEDRLQVPAGYRAVRATGVMYASAWKFDVFVAVGAANFRDVGGDEAMPMIFDLQLANETTTVPYAFVINNAWGFAYTLEVICQRTDRALEKWQIQTFNAIMQAYENLHSAWEERQRAASIGSAGVVTGTNPSSNRQVERTELKKSVISLLSDSPLHQFGAIEQVTLDAEPVVDDLAAVGQSAAISFYEQAFEWENTVYTLYPYFWGRHSSWPNAFTGSGVDPMHDAFLTAGLARVVIPVRPGFEQVAGWFLATGQVWYGGSPPPISSLDPLYVSIAAEILAVDEAQRGGVLQGSTWQVTTPTNLVYLQPDADLNPPP
jgi:hypothetical protein